MMLMGRSLPSDLGAKISRPRLNHAGKCHQMFLLKHRNNTGLARISIFIIKIVLILAVLAKTHEQWPKNGKNRRFYKHIYA